MREDVTAEKLFDEYVKQISRISFATFESSFTDYIEPAASETNTLAMAWTIDFVGKRYRKLVVNDEESKNSSESILNSNAAIGVSIYPDIDVDGELSTNVTSYISVPEDYWNRSLRLLYESYPFGYFENGPVCDSIVDTILPSRKTMFQDEDGVGLRCQTDEFDIQIWFDIEKDYMAKKIQITRRSTPQSPDYLSTAAYEVQSFEKVGEFWFPATFTVRESFPGGTIHVPPGVVVDSIEREPQTLVAEVTLKNVQFPDRFTEADFQIKTPIPNGTQVWMQDARHDKYVWYNGKIVPMTNEVMLAIAQGDRKFTLGCYWMIAISIVLILIGGGSLAYKHFVRKA
ncbi:MAG: hypothetical protein LBI05_09495 [Planctomycetaceae bacterium]|nr:hypothetical protein [Planctomycetaceae bacterium]